MNILVRALLFATFLQFAAFGMAQAPQDPTDDPIIRINVELVQVDAQVLEKKSGRPVDLLGRGLSALRGWGPATDRRDEPEPASTLRSADV